MGELSDRLRAMQGSGEAGAGIAGRLRAMQSSTGPAPIWRGPNNGRVYRLGDGSLQYVDANMSTKDPAKIEEIMGGSAAGDVSRQGINEALIAENPVGARAASVATGVPFVGEYVDEMAGAVAGPEARQGVRMLDRAMEEAKPIQDAALGLGGAAATLPAMPMGAAGWVGRAGSRIGQAMRGAALGSGAGAVEGSISGAGRYEDDRVAGAVTGGAVGSALGGILGAASPLVSEGLAGLVNKLKFQPFKSAARDLGVSEDAAKVAAQFIEAEGPDAARRIGRDGMVADMGGNVSGLLDTAMQAPGGARIGNRAVRGRVRGTGRSLTAALDKGLGPAQGNLILQRALREGSQPARSSAYDAAYAKPIDYAAAAGRKLEELWDTIPEEAIRYANKLLALDGHRSKQILFDVAEDGTITARRMPDVRQWDYIKRGLDQTALTGEGKGAMGGQTPMGSKIEEAALKVRNYLKEAVPEYGTALDTAADIISQIKGVDFGTKLLATKSPEQVEMALNGATKPERAAMASGLRQFIDDTLANVKAVASDPDIDGRQVREAMRLLTSPAARKKMALLLGDKAKPVFAEVDKAMRALKLQADVASNSRTFGRQETEKAIQAISEPGILGKAAQGEVGGTLQRSLQELTGATPAQMTERQAKVRAELADLLTRTGDKRALNIVRRLLSAQRQTPITTREVQMISNLLTGALGLGAYETLSRGVGE